MGHDASRIEPKTSPMPATGVTLCAILRVPLEGVAAFRAYEAAVLPMLLDHGGTLQRRLRTEDGLTEIHVLWFPSLEQVAAYRADPRRVAHAGLFTGAGATADVLTVQDVATA
jgi:hypothetical protein